jgi:hypothetical protein
MAPNSDGRLIWLFCCCILALVGTSSGNNSNDIYGIRCIGLEARYCERAIVYKPRDIEESVGIDWFWCFCLCASIKDVNRMALFLWIMVELGLPGLETMYEYVLRIGLEAHFDRAIVSSPRNTKAFGASSCFRSGLITNLELSSSKLERVYEYVQYIGLAAFYGRAIASWPRNTLAFGNFLQLCCFLIPVQWHNRRSCLGSSL